MFYALLKPDGSLDRYPYTLTDLRLSNKGTSWPKVISDEVAASFNVYRVTPTPQPASDYSVNLERTAVKVNGTWVEQWIETPATPEEIAERTAAKASEVRADRNQRLADCDWTQLPDAPGDKVAWATYRQELRDVPSQANLFEITWPIAPDAS